MKSDFRKPYISPAGRLIMEGMTLINQIILHSAVVESYLLHSVIIAVRHIYDQICSGLVHILNKL